MKKSAWVSANDLTGLEALAAANQARNSGLSDKERDQRNAAFTASIDGHSDELVRSLVFEARPTSTDSGFFTTSSVRVQRGHNAAYRELWDKYNKPVYEKLLADGTILCYGLDVQMIHTSEPGTHTTWVGLPSAEAHTRMRAAFRADREGRSEEERRAIQEAFWSHVVEGSHRDGMSTIVHYAAR